jgi:hypothetical protein
MENLFYIKKEPCTEKNMELSIPGKLKFGISEGEQ